MISVKQWKTAYLVAVSLLGGVTAVWSINNLLRGQPDVFFLLFLTLGVVAQVSATTATIRSKTAITYVISPAISLSSVPFYGPGGAAIIEIVTSVALWLIKPADERTWKKSGPQLAFNAGMSTISIFMAGWTLLLSRQWLAFEPILMATLPWLIASLANDQVNFWLLSIMLHIQYGREFNPLTIFKENAWATPISIIGIGVGGGLLAYAFAAFGWVGVAAFFLPIFLSSYAFHLYVRQTQGHMANLENIIAERTRELAETNKELAELNKDLEELNKEKDAFLAILTHDMKTPLTSINIYTSLIKEQPHLVIEKPHMVDILMSSQQTLLNIVNNILDLEKLQIGGKLPTDKEPFDLTQVVEWVLQMVEGQAEEKDIVLLCQFGTRPIIINADRKQIERTISNLVANAIKYTPNEGIVNVTVKLSNQDLVIQVEDTGYGIPPDELPHIFERFRRVAKHKSKAVGTGLGLAITKAIVEAHGGRICVESEEGEGSLFTIKLPALSETEPTSR